jgi:hypothetical protein
VNYPEQDNGASDSLQFWKNFDVCDDNTFFFTASSNCDDASMLLKQAAVLA